MTTLSPNVPLSAAEEKFCRALVANGGKVSDAYREAYPDRLAGRNLIQVRNAAAKLRKRAKIQAYLEVLAGSVDSRIAKEFDVRVERIAKELSAIGFADPLLLFDEAGELRNIANMPEEIRRAISSIETVRQKGEDGQVELVRKIRFWDKNQALQSLAKWKRMLVDQKEVGAPGEFDALSDEEVDRELAALETRHVLARASKAAMKAPVGPAPARARADGRK